MSRFWRPLSIRTQLTLWYTSVLLATLLLVSVLSYSALAWSLRQDLDASLLAVAGIIRDTGRMTGDLGLPPGLDAVLRDLLGPDFFEKFFQLMDPQGRPGFRSPHLEGRVLPLSPEARDNATHGRTTFETVWIGRQHVRLLTSPVVRGGRVVHLIQVGMPMTRTERTLARYVETLLVFIPVGLGLAAAGGAATARFAMKPIDSMSSTARRISAEDLARRLALRGTGDELDRLAETLNAMLARLESAFAETRRLAADAAHELRTPLTALKGGLEVALRAQRSAPEYRQVLVSSLEEVERLIRLAEDLLLLSRSQAGLDTGRTRVELEPLVLDVLDVGGRLGHGRSVSVRLKETSPAVVFGDPIALRRAALNLVENAVKYTPPGGTVELSLAAANGHALVAVSDTGPGIAPSDVERVFDPFVRLDAARARDTGGAGLGLAITRSIVIAHGGTLSVESAPGAGSRFTIRLPLA